jgi:hypothetical protein
VIYAIPSKSGCWKFRLTFICSLKLPAGGHNCGSINLKIWCYGNKRKASVQRGFSACWLKNIYWSSRTLIICSPGCPNKAGQKDITSTISTSLNFGSGWQIPEYQHSRKPWPLISINAKQLILNWHKNYLNQDF